MTKAKRRRPRNFVDWIEAKVQLPVGLSAEPGPIRLPPYMREIAEALIDPAVERVTLQKATRVGFSTLLSSLVGYHMTADPATVLVVVPAELDARNHVIDIESIFDTSPALQGKLPTPSTAGRDSRNTLLYRRGKNGASLRLVGATAPRNLRAVTAKILIVDEADALINTAEGDAIALPARPPASAGGFRRSSPGRRWPPRSGRNANGKCPVTPSHWTKRCRSLAHTTLL